ncbi:hypothetical protein [Aquabacterium sp.]|uniref:hypothetical protein n=1 Tax=Aquabacterium sp. TaxID=1872578 RepID=UPI003D6D9114
MNTQRVLAAAILAGSAVLAPSVARAGPYTLTDFSAHGSHLSLTDINNAGDLVGQMLITLAGPPGDPDPYVEYHGFVLSHGQLTELAPFGLPQHPEGGVDPSDSVWNYFAYSGAHGLDQQGQVVGQADDWGTVYGRAVTGRQGFVYQNGQFTKLGDFNPAGINRQGKIAGTVGVNIFHGGFYDTRVATVYSNGQFTSLGSLGISSVAHGINDQGHVTGSSVLSHGMGPDEVEHAFLHDGTTLTDLGTLGGFFSEGLAINNAAQVTGSSTTGDGASHPFLYTDGQLIDLGLLAGTSEGSGLDINALGQVVGYSGDRAFLYSNEQLQDLNDLLDPATAGEWALSSAVGINDRGIIIGYGLHNGIRSAFMLTPVPEPQLVALLGSGLLVLALLTRRQAGAQPDDDGRATSRAKAWYAAA